MTEAPPLAIPSYLVAAMRANPADDGLRLQCADWFQENGQAERAEFVRVQVELAPLLDEQEKCKGTLRAYGMGVRIDPLRRRERELCNRIEWGLRDEWKWGVGLPGVVVASPCVHVVCGFVGRLSCSAADWLAFGDAICAREPVTAVTLTTEPEVRYVPEADAYCLPSRQAWTLRGLFELHKGLVGPREIAVALCRKEWPGVTFTLPELRAGMLMGLVGTEGQAEGTPPDHGTADWDVAESLSAAPPDSARRRGGHSRMPGWLADRRSRPGRR